MAILEKEVFVGVMGRNSNHYKKRGYDIPGKIDGSGTFRIPRGTKIKVKVKDLLPGSDVKVTKICDQCGLKVFNQPYGLIIKQREKVGTDNCEHCARKLAGSNRKKNLKYHDSLEYHALKRNRLYLIEEFSALNTKKMSRIAKASSTECIWECRNCKNSYEMSANKRYNGRNCPYCAGRRVNESNCVNTTHSYITRFLKNPHDGDKVTIGSHRKLEFICGECGGVAKKTIHNALATKMRCKFCSDTISYPEKFIINFLMQLSIKFEKEKTFPWAKNPSGKNKRYDFYIPDFHTIIEVHGRQHYDKSFEDIGGRTVEEEVKNDYLKKELAKRNGIESYIVINAKYSEQQVIKQSILKSELQNILGERIHEVDWGECEKYANKNVMMEVCRDKKMGNYDAEELSTKHGISTGLVRKYLNKGKLLGLCEYEPFEKKWRSIVQISEDGELIKKWENMRKASKELNTLQGNIWKAIVNRRMSAGYIWMYEEEYFGDNRDGIIKEVMSKKRTKEVYKIDLEMNVVDLYTSIKEAAHSNGTDPQFIGRVCRGERLKHKGYKWMYKEDYEKYIEENNKNQAI